MFYREINGIAYPCTVFESPITTGKNRTIAVDKVMDIEISTVFLGLNIDLGINPNKPILYETLITQSNGYSYTERYSTRAEAVDGHDRIVGYYKKIQNFSTEKKPAFEIVIYED